MDVAGLGESPARMSGLGRLFAPASVAVLGVSRHPDKLGHKLLQNLKAGGYAGRIHPVHPSAEPILGLATLPAVEALPEGVDLALVSLPAAAVPGALAALAARKVGVAVILSSGFGEVGGRGRETEQEVLSRARGAGLRLVGPNCMGVYSAPARLNGTYFWDLPALEGGIGVVSQSGAYGGLIFRHLGGRGLGVRHFLSIGNQADVDVAEAVEYLADDPATTLIACFVEALREGRRFVEIARRATAVKPLVVLKGGRSEAGRRAAGSHTGALAGSYEVYRAGLRRAGALLAEDTEDFFDAIEALALSPGPRPASSRIAVITVSGGPSVVAADHAERSGLTLPALSDAARSGLRALLPAFAAVGNPVDLTPQVAPERIAPAVRLVFDEPEIAGVVAVDVGLDIPEFADAIAAAAGATGKPAVAFTADAPVVAGRLRSGGVVTLPSPERAVRAWRTLWRAGVRVPEPPAPVARPEIARMLEGAPPGPLPYALARRVLEESGVVFCREAIASTEDEAVAAAEAIGYPVVVKADAPDLLHRTEADGVRLDVGDAARVRLVWRDLHSRLGAPRVIVQERLTAGVELLVGARRDPAFGPVVAVGAGGVLTEAIGDVSLALAPLAPAEAAMILRRGVRARLLAGVRGRPACDDASLVAAMVGIGDLIAACPRVIEIDVNPLIASSTGAVAVDALIIVGEASSGSL
jgi:acetate---CoA ligase (ADP-forming)